MPLYSRSGLLGGAAVAAAAALLVPPASAQKFTSLAEVKMILDATKPR